MFKAILNCIFGNNYDKEYERESRSLESKHNMLVLKARDWIKEHVMPKFMVLDNSDYTRVKYILKFPGFNDTETKKYRELQSNLYTNALESLLIDKKEYISQVRSGRVSECTLDILHIMCEINYNAYPNGRYNSYYEYDEIIYYNKYKLKTIQLNLLEG